MLNKATKGHACCNTTFSANNITWCYMSESMNCAALLKTNLQVLDNLVNKVKKGHISNEQGYKYTTTNGCSW